MFNELLTAAVTDAINEHKAELTGRLFDHDVEVEREVVANESAQR